MTKKSGSSKPTLAPTLEHIRQLAWTVEAVPAETRQLRVQVQAGESGDAQVAVIDGGCGLRAEEMPRLFEAFFSTKSAGLGMGLAISRTIIEAHGGRIWAFNNPDGGATFAFTLPREQR